MPDQTFPNRDRIRKQSDFDRVYAAQAFAADDVLVIRGCRNEFEYSRLGLSVSRRVGPAVVRNRWKRLIRETFRTGHQQIPRGYDFVVRPRRGASLSFPAIARSLPQLSHRLVGRLEKQKK